MAPLMPMHDSATAFLTTTWRCTSSCTQIVTAVSGFLVSFAHCACEAPLSSTLQVTTMFSLTMWGWLPYNIHCLPRYPIHFIKHTWDLPCFMWAGMSRLADYLLKLCNHTSMETYLHTWSIKANLMAGNCHFNHICCALSGCSLLADVASLRALLQ